MWLRLCWYKKSSKLSASPKKSQVSYFHGSWSQGTISRIKHTRVCGLVTAHRLRSTLPFLLYCKKTESLKYSSFLNNSSPPLPPSARSVFLPILPGEHQRSGTDKRASSPPELWLSAQSCTLEGRKAGLHTMFFVFYFCYCQRNMQKGLLCCILNVMLHFLSAYAQ